MAIETINNGETGLVVRGKINDNFSELDSGKAAASHTHTKDQVGLSNVDNTADANKPVSTAQATADNAARDAAITTIRNSVATEGDDLAKLLALINAIDVPNVIDDLTTGGTEDSLSAEQGKTLKGLIDAINTLLLSDESTLDTLQEIVDFIELNREDLDSLTIASIAGLQAALDLKAEFSGTLGQYRIPYLNASNKLITTSLFTYANNAMQAGSAGAFIGNSAHSGHGAAGVGANKKMYVGDANTAHSALAKVIALKHSTDTDFTYDFFTEKALIQSLILQAATELTIASGSVALSRSQHTIDNEGDAATDDLTTVTGYVANQYYLFKAADLTRVPTIKSSGNIVLKSGDMELSYGRHILFIGTATGIEEVMRSQPADTFIYPLSTAEGAIAIKTNVYGWRAPYAGKFVSVPVVTADLTAPTGAAILVDMNKNGSTVMTNRFMIDATETSSETGSTAALMSSMTFAKGDYFTWDIDQVGTTLSGERLTITFRTIPT